MVSRNLSETIEVILDPFCLLHLHASERIEQILRGSALRFAVAGYVLRNESVPNTACGLGIGTDPLVERAVGAGLLRVLELEDDSEALTLIDLVSDLDDSEAHTCALAIRRHLGFATDEIKARRLAERLSPGMWILGTSTLLRRWAVHAQPGQEEVKATLRRIQDNAGYLPADDAADSVWWRKTLRQ